MKLKIVLIVVLMCLGHIQLKAQLAELPFNEDDKICYTGIIDVPNKTKEEIYEQMKEYLFLNYTNKGNPITIDEKDNRLYVKGSFKVKFRKKYFPVTIITRVFDEVYTLKLFFKDNRMKYEIVDVTIQRKLDARVSGINWGYGLSSAKIKEAKIIMFNLEEFYTPKHRKKFGKLYQESDSGMKEVIKKFTNYLSEDNNLNNW
jgi:hypothetical protein